MLSISCCSIADGPNWQVALEADRQNIPVVFMTGDPEHAKELVGGARPYLLKPFGLAALIDAIDSNARQESLDSEPVGDARRCRKERLFNSALPEMS
jgi:FixJ family two-component response regulator